MQFSRIVLGRLLNRITYSVAHWGRYCHTSYLITYSVFQDRSCHSSVIYSSPQYWRYSHSHSQFSRIIFGSLLNRIPYSALCWQLLWHFTFVSTLENIFTLNLPLPPFWWYSQSRILSPSTGIVTHIAPFEGCITLPLTHVAVFTFTYFATHIGRYCHRHPFGGTLVT